MTTSEVSELDCTGWLGKVSGTVSLLRDGNESVLGAADYIKELLASDELRCAEGASAEVFVLNGETIRFTAKVWTKVAQLPPTALIKYRADRTAIGGSLARLARQRGKASDIILPWEKSSGTNHVEDLRVLWDAAKFSGAVTILISDDLGSPILKKTVDNAGRLDFDATERSRLAAQAGQVLVLRIEDKARGYTSVDFTVKARPRDAAPIDAPIAAPTGWPRELVATLRATNLIESGRLQEAQTELQDALKSPTAQKSVAVQSLLSAVNEALARGSAAR